jgi:RNA polymerase sigma factor (sigma-70 family)
MQELDDITLLREYAERDSEAAFAALVTRHVNKVYSVALRHTGNPHSAEEITQAVFVILARKSRQLGKRVILSGWLYQTARLTAVTFIRGGIRRARREQEACMQTALNKNESETWMQIAPLLDAAMAGLNETDRHAVVLRFFDGKSLREVGTALGANEEAAKKRVSRALEKLRAFFAQRGVNSTTAIIAGAISANSVQAAPVALAKSVTAIAVAKGTTASGSTLTLIKGALKIMAWTKAKTAILADAVVILAASTTTLVVHHQHQPQPLPQPKPVASTETNFPKNSWAFAGYADPQSALLSALWSLNGGDLQTFLASLTLGERERQQQQLKIGAQRAGKSLAAFFAGTSKGMPETKGFRVLDQQVVSDDQVILRISIEGTGRGKQQEAVVAKMIKTGNEWKLDSLGPQ